VCLGAGLVGVVRRIDSRIDPVEWHPRRRARSLPAGSWRRGHGRQLRGPGGRRLRRGRPARHGPDQNHVVRTVGPVEADTTNADLERVAADDGTHWLAITTPRGETLDGLHARPRVKRQLDKLPTSAMQQVEGDPYGLVLQLDADGEIVDSLQDPGGVVFGVTSATPHDGALSLGSLFGDRVVRSDLE